MLPFVLGAAAVIGTSTVCSFSKKASNAANNAAGASASAERFFDVSRNFIEQHGRQALLRFGKAAKQITASAKTIQNLAPEAEKLLIDLQNLTVTTQNNFELTSQKLAEMLEEGLLLCIDIRKACPAIAGEIQGYLELAFDEFKDFMQDSKINLQDIKITLQSIACRSQSAILKLLEDSQQVVGIARQAQARFFTQTEKVVNAVELTAHEVKNQAGELVPKVSAAAASSDKACQLLIHGLYGMSGVGLAYAALYFMLSLQSSESKPNTLSSHFLFNFITAAFIGFLLLIAKAALTSPQVPSSGSPANPTRSNNNSSVVRTEGKKPIKSEKSLIQKKKDEEYTTLEEMLRLGR